MPDGLAALQRALEADASLREVTVSRAPRRFKWTETDAPVDALVLTHPTTSTEFLIRWQPEHQGRLTVLREGPDRDRIRQIHEAFQGTPTDSSNDEYMDGRSYGTIRRGTFDPDLSRPFYQVTVLEKADLHAPGHDDFGEFRADRKSGLSIPLFAASPAGEVLDWFGATVARLVEVVVPPMPAALAVEREALIAWSERARQAKAEAEDPAALAMDAQSPVTEEVGSQVAIDRLMLTFPRDGKGRLAPRARVLLAPTGSGSDLDRGPWVVVAGPSRVGGRTLTVRVEPVIAINEVHRFDLAPWLWRREASPLSEPATWGGPFDDATAIRLLRRGKIEEGLRAAGLHLDEALTRMARGQVLGVIYDEPAWSQETRERLSLMFPGLLLSAGLAYARRALRRRSDGLRLFTFPGQRHARKASVVFVPSDPPSLKLDWTGSNRRLPSLLWQRPPIPGAWSGL